ncbi:MAG: cupin domain-containing protein [Solirubrobacterales bacterium]|nr:cupin domain-containing protein [Solirubrobacterales bacterium]
MPTHKPTPSRFVSEEGEGDAYWFGSAAQANLAIIRARGGDSGVTVTEIIAPVGTLQPLHIHETHDDNFLVLEGHITMYCGGEVFAVGPRMYVSLPKGVPHSWRVDEGPARVLGFYDTEDFARFIVEVCEPATSRDFAAATGLDERRAADAAERFGMKLLGPPPAELLEGLGPRPGER